MTKVSSLILSFVFATAFSVSSFAQSAPPSLDYSNIKRTAPVLDVTKGSLPIENLSKK